MSEPLTDKERLDRIQEHWQLCDFIFKGEFDRDKLREAIDENLPAVDAERCPICRSTDIEKRQRRDVIGQVDTDWKACNECGAQWDHQ